MNASGPTIAPIVTGLGRIEHLARLERRQEPVDLLLRRQLDPLVGVGEDESVHADHHRERELLGQPEREHVRVDGVLVGLDVQLDPAGVTLRHRVGVVVPDVDRRTDRAVGDGHHDRQARARRRCRAPRPCTGAPGWRSRCTCARRSPHAPIATDMAANSDSTLMNSQGASRRLHQRREPLDDVRLRRDRICRDHLGAAARDRAGDRCGPFDLLKQLARLPRELWRSMPRRRSRSRSASRTKRSRMARTTLSTETIPVSAATPPSSAAFGAAAADVFAGELGRRHRADPVARAGSRRPLGQPQLVERAQRVDQHVAVGPQPAEHVDLVEQRRVPTITRVGLEHRLAGPDRAIVDPAERDRPARRCAPSRSSGTPARGRPRANAASESSSAAVTTPCPPRP